MKEIKTTIYECEFCRKYYKRKHFAIRHEMQCHLNPNNRHVCYDCSHLKVIPQTEYGFKKFICKIDKKEMHTCIAESRGFADKLDTTRMPINCTEHLLNIDNTKDVNFKNVTFNDLD